MPVVAGIDRSERAQSVLERAATLAADAGLELHVTHVGTPGVPTSQGGYNPDRDRDLARKRAKATARETAEDVDAVEAFEPVGLLGNPAQELMEYSDERNAEYIVVSARKRSPMGQALFGSVTQALLLQADRPVVATPHKPT
ncbi:universal stress protein [Natrialbaceae archaeon AArc-T1-2]|uniref:universal stress protein n=1 Tax=Natrialbaceae archaeon AArc-T1-2 TaxID=3053904 RepID=UPI00255B2DEE|nr:universal stress protein [Natrialbaceae archaeon AArc-T1-2]WIV66142.1 universal stress protein [Natrialbaceae archaeon AArc-T1-2]